MHALTRYPRHLRSAIAREWARRSNAVQSLRRAEREPRFQPPRAPPLYDARGQILREGVCYTATKTLAWKVVRSLRGRTDQFDLVSNGRVVRTCGARRMPKDFRPKLNRIEQANT